MVEQAILDQIIAYVSSYGLPVGVAFIAGLLGKPAIGLLRPIVTRTPTKVDDMLLNGFEAILKSRDGDLSRVTAEQLNKFLTTRQIVELVKLRKTQIEAAKKK